MTLRAAVGQILLTLLVAIIPIRFFSLVALLFGAASAGIAMLSALIGMLTYIPLNEYVPPSATPSTR
jgi:hypothetical protein